jgi:hypothetical protein
VPKFLFSELVCLRFGFLKPAGERLIRAERLGGCWMVPRPLMSLATSSTFFKSGSSGTGVTLLQIARAVIRSLTLWP